MATTRRAKQNPNRVSISINIKDVGYTSVGVDFKDTDDTMQIAHRVDDAVAILLRTMRNLNLSAS